MVADYTGGMKRLYRSRNNKTVAGVLGGLGEYLDIDPVLLRLFYVAVTVFTAVVPGIIVYVLAFIIVPTHAHASENTTAH